MANGTANRTSGLVSFGDNGGNIRISAGADVAGAPVTGNSGDYGVTGWLLRQGNATTPTMYGTNLAAFNWNAGAIGGGDAVVRAAGQIGNLSVAVADSYAGAANSATGIAGLVGAGGGLRVSAAGDIGSAQIYVADGSGSLVAGGGLTAVRTNPLGGMVGSSIALGNAAVSVSARQAIQVDALYNPTYTAQGGAQTQANGAYLTYGDNSALSLAHLHLIYTVTSSHVTYHRSSAPPPANTHLLLLRKLSFFLKNYFKFS